MTPGVRTSRLRAGALCPLALATAFQLAPLSAHGQAAAPAAAPCTPEGGLRFLCGIRAPEDLAVIPATDWIIASSFTTDGSGGLYAIDSRRPGLTRIFPAATARSEPDLKTYPACTTPPDPANFSALGLSIRPRAGGGGWLYVVGGGARHGIEAFKVDVTTGAPVVTWIGCVPAPPGATLNAVAGMYPGEVVTSAIFEAPYTFADALAGKITGNLYVRLAGEPLRKVPNTGLAGDNGVEVNREHRYIFVAATGTRQVLRYERADPTQAPVTLKLDFGVDNLRTAPDGRLVVAGKRPAADCLPGQTCPPHVVVLGIDRATMAAAPIISFPTTPHWSGSSTALIVGKTLWLGSPTGDRIAYRDLP